MQTKSSSDLISIKIKKKSILGKKIVKLSEKYNIGYNAAFNIITRDMEDGEKINSIIQKDLEVMTPEITNKSEITMSEAKISSKELTTGESKITSDVLAGAFLW